MHIDPKDAWRVYPQLIGMVLFMIAMVVLPIPIIIMAFFWRPLLYFACFFLVLAACHLLLVPAIFKTRMRYVGVVLIYTAVVDITAFALTGRFAIFMLLPPLIAGLLVASAGGIQFVVNHHVLRNMFRKFRKVNFGRELKGTTHFSVA